jgi:hypothetical protein
MVKNFGTVLNCIDGRTQIPVIEWMKANFCLDYVDSITEPGMDGVLSHGNSKDIGRIKDKVIISINAHNSRTLAVVGHYDCAANPVSVDEHIRDIAVSVNIVKSWLLPLMVVGLWVDESWKVHLVCM